MAREFGATHNNSLHRFPKASLISTDLPQPFSLLIRINPNNTGVRQAIYSNNQSGSPELFISVEAANTVRMFLEGADRAVSSAQTFTVGKTHSFGFVYHADDTLKIYLDGLEIANGSHIKISRANNPDSVIGGLTSPGVNGFNIDGEVSDFGFYGVGLTAEDNATYAKNVSPKLIRPSGLVSHLAMIGEGNNEVDDVLGETWKIKGTLTKADHPGIFMPSPAIIGIPVAAVGGHTANITKGDLTLAGKTLAAATTNKHVADILAGALTLAGKTLASAVTEKHVANILKGDLTLAGQILAAATTENILSTITSGTLTLAGKTMSVTVTEKHIANIAGGALTLSGKTMQAVVTAAGSHTANITAGTLTLDGKTMQSVLSGLNLFEIERGVPFEAYILDDSTARWRKVKIIVR